VAHQRGCSGGPIVGSVLFTYEVVDGKKSLAVCAFDNFGNPLPWDAEEISQAIRDGGELGKNWMNEGNANNQSSRQRRTNGCPCPPPGERPLGNEPR